MGVGVKLIRACCGARGPLCCGAPPQGLCKAPHDPGICWKQFMMRLEDTWFVAAFHSTPMHDQGPEELQRPVRVCVCKGASVLPSLLRCCCWRRRPPAVRRPRLRAAPPPGACTRTVRPCSSLLLEQRLQPTSSPLRGLVSRPLLDACSIWSPHVFRGVLNFLTWTRSGLKP